jgi:cephalosporin hydroxylase
MNVLTEIINKYGANVSAINRGTGQKNTGGDAAYSGYVDRYVELFEEIRERKINLLEIGIFQGRSLAMWSDYFSSGNIYGADISVVEFNLMREYLHSLGAFSNNNLCEVVEGDSTNLSTFEKSIDLLPMFDIIIDDGKHTHAAQLQTFKNFYSRLSSSGFYIIEDMHNHWKYALKSDIWDLNGHYKNIRSVDILECIRDSRIIVVRKF